MKKALLIFALVVGGFFIINTHCCAESAKGPGVLKVKGLYLGMDIDDACRAVNQMDWNWSKRIAPPFIVAEIKKDPETISRPGKDDVYVIDVPESKKKQFKEKEGIAFGFRMPIVITAGADRKVNYISIDQDMVNALFNAYDMEAEDFNQEFMTAYQIPGMELWDEGMGWQFRSGNGYRVRIDGVKRVIIDKISEDGL